MRIVILIAVTLTLIIVWFACIAASASDEEAERMYQDYLEYKRRKEMEESDE